MDVDDRADLGPTSPSAAQLELRCGSVAAGGGFVARAPDGRVVFVRHALPGELVLATVTAETTSFLRADAVVVLEPSADRVDPPCPHAGAQRCGGCDWQHISLPTQRRLKSELVAEQLRRIAGIEMAPDVEEVPGAPDGLGWRTRVRFAVERSGRVGLRRHRSHDVEPLEACPVATPSVEAVGVEALRWRGASEVEVFAVDPPVGSNRPDGAGPAVVVLVPGHSGIRRRDIPVLPGPRHGLVAEGEVLKEPASVEITVLDRTFRVSPGSFWQAHRAAPALLARAVLDALGPRPGERAIDLYAGVGLFSALLADAVGRDGAVVAVERDKRACADLRHNAAGLERLTVRTAPVSAKLIEATGSADLVVLDPPREGAGRGVMSALAALDPAPRRVAYVSCDPATFARDVAVLFGSGWTMPALRAFDLFPMTEHVELVGVLEPPDALRAARERERTAP